MSAFEEGVKRYDAIVEQCPDVERKGKTVPYTSANTHMFSLVNKEGHIGFRFDKDTQERYIKEFNSDDLMSHGSTPR